VDAEAGEGELAEGAVAEDFGGRLVGGANRELEDAADRDVATDLGDVGGGAVAAAAVEWGDRELKAGRRWGAEIGSDHAEAVAVAAAGGVETIHVDRGAGGRRIDQAGAVGGEIVRP